MIVYVGVFGDGLGVMVDLELMVWFFVFELDFIGVL